METPEVLADKTVMVVNHLAGQVVPDFLALEQVSQVVLVYQTLPLSPVG
jgi:hypothetical protein